MLLWNTRNVHSLYILQATLKILIPQFSKGIVDVVKNTLVNFLLKQQLHGNEQEETDKLPQPANHLNNYLDHELIWKIHN